MCRKLSHHQHDPIARWAVQNHVNNIFLQVSLHIILNKWLTETMSNIRIRNISYYSSCWVWVQGKLEPFDNEEASRNFSWILIFSKHSSSLDMTTLPSFIWLTRKVIRTELPQIIDTDNSDICDIMPLKSACDRFEKHFTMSPQANISPAILRWAESAVTEMICNYSIICNHH